MTRPALGLGLRADVSEVPVLTVEIAGEKLQIPAELPLLPVRNTVVFPGTTRPLSVGRPRSLGALREASRKDGYLAVVTQRVPDVGDESPLGVALNGLKDLANRVSLEDAVEEYHELFIGVAQGELLPYKSYYLTGFLNEKPLAELRGDMDEIGIAKSEDASEPEDHIAALCEMMHGLITGSFGKPLALPEQNRFFEAHIGSWAFKFFEDLEAAKAARLYMPVGLIGKLFVDVECEAFLIAA